MYMEIKYFRIFIMKIQNVESDKSYLRENSTPWYGTPKIWFKCLSYASLHLRKILILMIKSQTYLTFVYFAKNVVFIPRCLVEDDISSKTVPI